MPAERHRRAHPAAATLSRGPIAQRSVKSPIRAVVLQGCRRMWEEEELDAASRRKFAWLAGIVAAAAALVGGWYWYSHRAAPAEPAPTVPTSPVPAAEPAIAHPIPGEAGEASALPALNDSDQLAHDSLAGVIGRDPVDQFIIPQSIVRHVVVTVD